MPRTLFIIDGHAHIYAAYYAPMRGRLSSPSGEPTKAAYIFTQAVLGLIERHNPDMLVVAMDSKEKTFRHDLYADYKAQRPPMPDDLPGQIARIEQILDGLNIPILRIAGYEADDIIGTLASRAAAAGCDVYICSGDKDILQLIDDHVFAYDLKTDRKTDLAALAEKMGVTPRQFLDVLALQGDTSDNIPGVPDVGPKTALAWIQQYGSLDNLLAHADEIKGKRGENLRRFQDRLDLSRKLITIDTNAPIEIPLEVLDRRPPDTKKLMPLLTELGFTHIANRLKLVPATSQPPADLVPGPSAPLVSRAAKPRPTVQPYLFDTGGTATASATHRASNTEHTYHLINTPDKLAHFAVVLRQQPIFALDTETTSIAAMRADLVGMSFSWKAHEAYYLAIRAPLGTPHLDLTAVRKALGEVLADPAIRKIGQNLKFDLLVLRNAGLPVKGVHFDTMVASYCLDPLRRHGLDAMARDFLDYEPIPISDLIGKGAKQITFDRVDTAVACEYAAEDADVTWQLYEYLRPRLEAEPAIRQLFEEVEMPLVEVLAAMEYNGVSLDAGLLRNMSGELAEAIDKLTAAIYAQAGTEFNIDSPKQLGEVLFDRLGLASTRIGKTGRSTDAAVLEELVDEHPIVEMVLQYRGLTKLKRTYLDALGSLIHPRTGRVHASFNQTVTATGRLSSSDPNLQNIPIRTELGSKIRAAFVPQTPDGCILAADYSQIELRFLAHFSGDQALRQAFAEDRDIHRFVASQVYGVAEDAVTPDMRSRSKAVNFGIIYGQGAFGLARQTGMTQGEARQFIEDYFRRYASIRAFMDRCIADARRTGYAETILGRRRRIDDLHSRNANKRALAERLAVNTVIQGSAADLIKVAMVAIQRRIEREFPAVRMILQVHDELVFEMPGAEAAGHAEWIRQEMAGAMRLETPLKVDIGWGPNWLAGK